MHTTNYYNTFIAVAPDSPATSGEIPPQKKDKTIAGIAYEMIEAGPYKYTSDDVLFEVFAKRNDVCSNDRKAEREEFFSKGQACFRASPLTKRYGWGVHFDKQGKMAIYGADTAEYKKFLKDKNLAQFVAVRSKRAGS